jgi:Protein of unknown function (DUF4058)
MPVHDWTRVDAGLFHAFHQGWICSLTNALNDGNLPPDHYALPEARVRSALDRRVESDIYAKKADRLTVRHDGGHMVAIIEVLSPGDKSSKSAFQAFVEKSANFIRQGVHLLVIDLFPPGKQDPQGVHKAIWDEFVEADFDVPADKPLTVASYTAGTEKVAYLEPVGVGDVLPEMPLFLLEDRYVQVPLETTYETTWSTFPAALKGLLEP